MSLGDLIFGHEICHFGSETRAAANGFEDLVQHATFITTLSTVAVRVSALSTFLFGDCGFQFVNESQCEDFTLTRTLLRRRGNCLGLTTLYVAFCARLGIPVVPLLFESHVAGCVNDGPHKLIVEMSRNGIVLPPSFSRLYYRDDKGVILSCEEFVAVHLSNFAVFCLVPRQQKLRALTLLDQSLRMFPRYTAGRINRTYLLLQLGRRLEAATELQNVFSLKPASMYRQVAESLAFSIGALGLNGTAEAARHVVVSPQEY